MHAFEVSYKANKNIIYSCKYHVVWCPKYRRKMLINGIDERLKNIIKDLCKKYGAELFEMEVMPEHVHILVEVDPQFGIHTLIKRLKGSSSRILRFEFPWLCKKLPTLWTNSYFVSTIGGAPLEVIKQYIEKQKNV
jgi:putative transposase